MESIENMNLELNEDLLHQNHSVLVTGATGFVGQALIEYLLKMGVYKIYAAVRVNTGAFSSSVHVIENFDITKPECCLGILEDIDCVIHCAGRVHVMTELSSNPLEEFKKVNLFGTLNLAEAAAKAGVKRFIFLSSIGVNGAQTFGKPYTADDIPMPHSDYAQSKYLAEQALQNLLTSVDMEVVIIRPPLVYGPAAKGNFNRMCAWVNKAWPLPFGAIKNKRSFVSVDNLVDLIEICMTHPKAANQIFLVSDGNDLSTPELLKKVSHAIDKPLRLVTVPIFLLKCFAKLVKRQVDFDRLCGSLQLDISKTCDYLDWQPKVQMLETLKRMQSNSQNRLLIQ